MIPIPHQVTGLHYSISLEACGDWCKLDVFVDEEPCISINTETGSPGDPNRDATVGNCFLTFISVEVRATLNGMGPIWDWDDDVSNGSDTGHVFLSMWRGSIPHQQVYYITRGVDLHIRNFNSEIKVKPSTVPRCILNLAEEHCPGSSMSLQKMLSMEMKS